jgi:DUF4097 and DUF4098 domain-containing protein YvlB
MPTYTFGSPTPTKLYVELAKGRIDVSAVDTDEAVVTVEGEDPDAVRVEQDGDEIRVIGPKQLNVLGFGPKGHDVTVTLPLRSQLRAKTGSADVTTHGPLRALWAQTGSGDLDVEQVDGPATIATGSGDVEIERVAGELQVKTGSGDVDVARSGERVLVATGSGDVRVRHASGEVTAKTGSGNLTVDVAEGDVSLTTGSGDLAVRRAVRGRVTGKGASSDIHIGIPAGTPVWTDINTVTGSIRSGVTGAGQPGDGQDHVELRARTVSGDIILEQL